MPAKSSKRLKPKRQDDLWNNIYYYLPRSLTLSTCNNYLIISNFDPTVHNLIDFKNLLQQSPYTGIIIEKYIDDHVGLYLYLYKQRFWTTVKKGVDTAFSARNHNMTYKWA